MTLSVTAGVSSWFQPRVALTVSSSPVVTAALRLYRVHEDGLTYRVLTPSGATIIGTWAGYDYHAPFGQSVTYYAATDSETSAVTGPVRPESDVSWLIHPSDPGLSVQVAAFMELEDPSWESDARESRVLNRRLGVSRNSHPRGGEVGSFSVQCVGVAARRAVQALLADGGPILVNTAFDSDDLGWLWVQPGNTKRVNVAGLVSYANRRFVIPYRETTQPDVDQRARTYAETAELFPGFTYTQTAGVWSTYQNRTLDVRNP